MGKRNRHKSKKEKRLAQHDQKNILPEFRITQNQVLDDGFIKNEVLIQNFLKELISLSLVKKSDTTEIVNEDFSKVLSLIPILITGIWRAQQKMVSKTTGEPLDEYRRVYRHLEVSMSSLESAGVELIDSTGKPYMPGTPDKVLAFDSRDDLRRETVIETIRPAIYYKKEMIQQAEIIVGTPVKKDLDGGNV
ncbi:MAG: hypothetical protein CL609_15075 [Anaerolineaceae bacterium]|nr:hypothetical protein [Anaerolineaceae bacterium]